MSNKNDLCLEIAWFFEQSFRAWKLLKILVIILPKNWARLLLLRQHFNYICTRFIWTWQIFQESWAKFFQIWASIGNCFGQIRTSSNQFGQICTCLKLRRNTAINHHTIWYHNKQTYNI